MPGQPTVAPPLRNERPWRYCAKCGEKMAWSAIGPSFSRETARPGIVWSWSCTRWTRHDSKHDRHDRPVHVE